MTNVESQNERQIRFAMERTAWEFGKLALLIDDQADANSRVARELYATEALPAWWWVARSMECATHALRAFHEIFHQPAFSQAPLRGLIIIDRYLPVDCTAAGGKRPIAWDQSPDDINEESPWRGRLIEIIRLLRDSSGPRFELKFVTSYPYTRSRRTKRWGGGAGPNDAPTLQVTWRIRSLELLPQYRQKISSMDSWKCLLHYGPEANAPVLSDTPPESLLSEKELEAARWKANVWWGCLQALANQMNQRVHGVSLPIILLTGAGASLAQGAYGAGMPETWRLLERACRKVERAASDQPEQGDRWPPPPLALCVCEHRERLPHGTKPRWKRGRDSTPVEWLLSRYTQGIQDLDWRLEELFNPLDHQRREEIFQKFHRSFRDALYCCDHGFAYHHWLIARMPWSAILTTNFDGFHERSSAAAAQIPWLEAETRSRHVQLGSPVPSWPQRPREVAVALLETAGWLLDESGHKSVDDVIHDTKARPKDAQPALFKPYGSLYSPSGDIALSLKEMGGFQGRFRAALAGALREQRAGAAGALVVIGHSMRDAFIAQVLEEPGIREELDKVQILWVDPAAYVRCQETSAQDGERTTWENLLIRKRVLLDKEVEEAKATARRVSGGGDAVTYSGPLPATALEFLHDLWLVLQGRYTPR